MYKGRVWIVDNFLSKKECKMLMKFHKDNQHLISEWFGTHTITLGELFPQIADRYNKLIPGIVIHWWQVVKWPTNVGQDLHFDVVKHDLSKQPPLTSITYLNDNYEGGQTMFADGSRFSPKQGRILVFDGQAYEHGVTKVTKGIRYTLPCWYKNA